VKELKWIGSSKGDLMQFPNDVIKEMGYALFVAQNGGTYEKTKPFKGYGSGVYEVAIRYNKDAYRTIYFIESGDKIYVIHCFQKKSKTGIKTPREEIVVIDKRLKWLKLGRHT